MKSPIWKLLFLTNQSSSGSLIYFALQMFWQLKEEIDANIAGRNKIQDSKLADIILIFYFYFQNKLRFYGRKDNPVEKVLLEEEELDGIEVYDILKLENLPRTSVRRLRILESECSC